MIDGVLCGSNLNNIPEHLLLVAITVSDTIALIRIERRILVHLVISKFCSRGGIKISIITSIFDNILRKYDVIGIHIL